MYIAPNLSEEHSKDIAGILLYLGLPFAVFAPFIMAASGPAQHDILDQVSSKVVAIEKKMPPKNQQYDGSFTHLLERAITIDMSSLKPGDFDTDGVYTAGGNNFMQDGGYGYNVFHFKGKVPDGMKIKVRGLAVFDEIGENCQINVEAPVVYLEPKIEDDFGIDKNDMYAPAKKQLHVMKHRQGQQINKKVVQGSNASVCITTNVGAGTYITSNGDIEAPETSLPGVVLVPGDGYTVKKTAQKVSAIEVKKAANINPKS